MKDWREMLLHLFFLCILSTHNGVSGAISSREVSLTDLRSKLDDMLINALKAHTYVPNSGIGNREELRLNDVARDVDTFGDFPSVRRWYSLSTLDTVYLIGLTEDPGLVAITLNQNKTIKNDNSQVVTLKMIFFTALSYRVSNAAIFQWWNSTSREMETICVTAIDSPEKDLKWYRFMDGKLVEFWSWTIHKAVNNLQVFTDERYVKLVLVNEAPSNTIAMYDIKLGLKPDFSLSQIIHFESAVESVAISLVGESIFMSVPQFGIDVISVFKLDTPTMLHSQFHLHENLTCKGVRDVTAFNTGYQSYLAVVGDVTMIYQFKFNGEIVKDLKLNLGKVAKWAPIKLATYRDDILLMARNSEDSDIYFLGWRGSDKGFTKLIGSDSFCSESQTKGAWQEMCSISKLGWAGATSFLLGGVDTAAAFFLIPNIEGGSSLFRLTTSFNPVKSPIIWELEILKKRKDFIQDLLDEQKDKISNIELKLMNTLRANTTNFVTGSWEINRISTPCLERGANFSVRNDVIDPNNNSKNSETSSFEKLKQIVDYYKKASEFVLDDELIKDAILKSGKVKNRVNAQSNTIIESANIDNSLNGISITDLFNGTYRLDSPRKVKGVKSVKNLRADSLYTSKISNRSFDDFIFSGEVVEIDKGIAFSNDVNVDDVFLPENGKVNGIDLSKDLFKLSDRNKGPLYFEDLQTEVFFDKSSSDKSNGHNQKEDSKPDGRMWENVISGRNLTVNKLNGRSWSEVVASAIWKNRNQTITGPITVNGRITARGSLLVEKDETSVKNAKLSDGKEKDALNKSEDYNHQDSIEGGSTVFEGDITKKPNKSTRCINRKKLLMQKLKTAKYMKGNLNLRGNLFIDGMLRTAKKNSQAWSDQVKSIILTSDPKPVINKSKHFHQLTVKGNLNAKKSINGFDLNSFMTKDGEQEISGSKTFKEHVVFENINLNGTWDGINITDLYENSIRLSSNQSLPGLHLIVEAGPSQKDDALSRITTSSLTVTSENRKPRMEVSPRSDIDESENSIPGFDVEKISFKEIEMMGSLFVEKRVAGYNFNDFLTKRVSLRENDNMITGNYSFKRIDADHLAGNTINGQRISKLKKGSVDGKTSTEKGSKDVLHIRELHVFGNIKTRNGVSGFNISKLSETAFFLNDINCVFNGTLQFEEEVTFEGLQVEGLVSGNNFTEFLHDAVRSNENNTQITSKKVFEKGLNIEGDLNLTLWNGVKVEDVLTRSSNQILKNKLITKNIKFSDKTNPRYFQVDGLLNGINFSELKENWKYSDDGVSQWHGNLSFGNDVTIDNFTIEGFILGTNFTKFVENVYIKNKNLNSSPSVILENDVSVLGDIFITGSYNDMNVEEFSKNVVFTTEMSEVKGNVSFTGKLIVSKDLRVFKSLDPVTLYGCDVEEWKNNAIYINKFRKNDLPIPGKLRFNKVTVSGNLNTDLIDDVDLNKAIFLNKHQTIHEPLKFSKVVVTKNVEVGRLVNGIHLQEEYEKTLLVNGDQVVSSGCNFLGEIEVLNNLETRSSVNGKLLHNAATLDGNHTIFDNLTFKCIVAKNEIDTNDTTISGINIENWNRRAFLKDTDQSVLGEWKVGGNVTFEKPLKGSGILNGINVNQVSNELNIWRKDQDSLHSEISSNFTNECSHIAEIVNKSRQQVYKLQHFETLQKISLDNSISSVHYFETRTGSFFVVSFSSSCRIFVYKWIRLTGRFKKSYEQLFKGPVDEWNTLKMGGKTFLVAQTVKDRPESNVTCSSNGIASLWEFDDLFGQLHFARELKDYGEILGTDEKSGYLYTFKDDMVSKWAFETMHSPPKLLETMKEEDIGFSRAVGSFTFEVNILSKLVRTDRMRSNIQFWDEPALQREFALHPQALFLAVSTSDSPEIGISDFVSIYRQNGSLFEKVPALRPFALTWIQFSQHTLLAFMDGNSTLQIYGLQQDGGGGFVRLLSTYLPSRDLQAMLLPLDNRTNKLPALLTYTENEINLISGNLAGSVYEGILPDCRADEGPTTLL
ncbi:hypothetical protein LSTR_LSTR011692 [Laodelphax striatellus]|uniref:Uncharacterized protein n=1 Tax=Laodelphax striatellus TaxID=195883 RepID=A0A482WUY3_LAOST|nr:hypothetical protein LSTR_LSTR011692 [Laodelphax striatellus]